MFNSYLNMSCPVCSAPRDVECTGFGVTTGIPHGQRIEAADVLQEAAVAAVVDEVL